MFIESLVSRARGKLQRYFLSRFTLRNHVDDQIYNYYGAYFSDVKREKYQLVSLRGKNVVLEKWHAEQHIYTEKINLPLNSTEKMNVEIIHWRKQSPLKFNSIFLFTINYFTRIAYVKDALTRVKSNLSSSLASNKALSGPGRITLLQMLMNEYAHQSPERAHVGVVCDEVIDLLYGAPRYKHIKNEDFRRKVFLLLQSLVITEDVGFSDEKYYIQGKAISTIISWESEDEREKQQVKIQKSISRLMFVIIASTLTIILAILVQTGFINLHNFQMHLTQLKSARVLFELI